MLFRSSLVQSELRAAVDVQRVARHPACVVGGEEGHRTGNVVRLGNALERLRAERHVAALVNQYLCALFGEREGEGAGTANAAGSVGGEENLAVQISHDQSPVRLDAAVLARGAEA